MHLQVVQEVQVVVEQDTEIKVQQVHLVQVDQQHNLLNLVIVVHMDLVTQVDKVEEIQVLKEWEAAAVVLYVRFLKRIGSHSRNIATSIVNPFHRIGYQEKKQPGSDAETKQS